MAKSYTYSYGANIGGISLTTKQINQLQILLRQADDASQRTPGQVGMAKPIYDYLLTVLPDPHKLSSLGIKSNSYWLTHAWLEGARDVNAGKGIFADYIRNYTIIQYELRYGTKQSKDLSEKINDASNAIGIQLATSIIDNAGKLPSLEGLGMVDGGEAARKVFAHAKHAPEGDYTAWAGTILFPFLGYDKFFRQWLLESIQINAKIVASPGETLSRIIKNNEGSYDLLAALQANQIAVDRYSAADVIRTLLIASPDRNQSDLVKDTTDLLNKWYALPESSLFKAGNLLPYVSPLTYINDRQRVSVGTLDNDVLNNYWSKPGNWIVHGGKGDDIIYAPHYAETAGQALMDGGEGDDILILESRGGPLHLNWVPQQSTTLYPGYFTIQRLHGSETQKIQFQAFAYSMERIEGTRFGDWLKISSPIRSDVNLLIDLNGMKNFLDYHSYSNSRYPIALSMSATGIFSSNNLPYKDSETTTLTIANAQTVFGSSVKNDLGKDSTDKLFYKNETIPLHISLENIPYESKEISHTWGFTLSTNLFSSETPKTMVYGFETLQTSNASDWLSLNQPLSSTKSNITVDLGGPGEHGNTLDLSQRTEGITIKLSESGTMSFPFPPSFSLNVLGLNNLVGTRFDDILSGNQLGNMIDGGPGVNTLTGGGGSDKFIIGVGDNYIVDADADDRLMLRLPESMNSDMVVVRGGVIYTLEMPSEGYVPIKNYAYFHPVKPDPNHYSGGLGLDVAPLNPSLGEFVIRYQLDGSTLKISTNVGNSIMFDTYVLNYENGDLGLKFHELLMPSYTRSPAHLNVPMDQRVARFEQEHLELLVSWKPPSLLTDLWLV